MIVTPLYLLILSDFRVSFHVPYIVFQNVSDMMNLSIDHAVTRRGTCLASFPV